MSGYTINAYRISDEKPLPKFHNQKEMRAVYYYEPQGGRL
jgi:hypothetical protein